MSITFDCKRKTSNKIERWSGTIRMFIKHGSHFEIRIESRSGISVIFGRTSQGGFTCMPDYETGCHISNFKDKFYNTEKLTAVLGEVDGITVAQALYALADKVDL